MKHVLVIEDNATIADGLRRNLEAEGYRVTIAPDGESGVEVVCSSQPDLVILDLMLPKMSGYDVLGQMRAARHMQPVLILSALSTEVEKIRGFRAGADDYVTKPFGIREVLARIEALLRRSESASEPPVEEYRFGSVHVNVIGRIAARNGTHVPLRPMEFDLLLALLRRPNQVISRKELLTEVWHYHPGVSSRTVDVHLCELRRKLEEDPDTPQHFETVWKRGYRMRL